VINLGLIEGRLKKTYRLPVALKDAHVEIEGTSAVKVLKVEELADSPSFSLVTISVDPHAVGETAFVLVVETSDKILKCEGRVKNIKPVELIQLKIQKNRPTMKFEFPVSVKGSRGRIEGTKALKITMMVASPRQKGADCLLVTVDCDPNEALHTSFELIVDSPGKVVIGEGRVDFDPDFDSDWQLKCGGLSGRADSEAD
jgi:hypothetical protein